MTARELIALLRRVPPSSPLRVEAMGREFEITDVVIRLGDESRIVIEAAER